MSKEILVVDDNSDIRLLISSILKDKGFSVRTAANFDQALLEINKKTPDLAVIDNGVGFNQIDKRKMLTPYFTTKKKGTGLGLAVVTKVVNDHNGVSMFDSISNGAKLEIKLPIVINFS